MDPQIIFKDMHEFYQKDPRRRFSDESDYGVRWRDRNLVGVTYRVSYVYQTGEIYARCQDPTDPTRELVAPDGSGGNAREAESGFVVILGVVPANHWLFVEKLLDSWEDHYRDGISWVQERLKTVKTL